MLKEVFDTKNIVPSALLAFLCWLGISTVHNGEAHAVNSVVITENSDSINTLIDKLEPLPKISEKLDSVIVSQKITNENVDLLFKEQQEDRIRGYCFSEHPSKKSKAELCISKLSGKAD